MTPIGVQRRLTELGRIRLGDKGSKGQPQRLTKFRLTSASKALLEAAAVIYGGTVRPWPDAPDEGYWQLHTTADALDILIPPTLQAYTQKYELWSGGGIQRRCDGDLEEITGEGCLCDPDARECQITTRVSVMLPKVPGLGVWRLETKGWNAAASLPSTLDLLGVGGRGTFVPAVLRLEQRSSRKAGQTRRFVVPVIDLTGITINDLLAAGAADAAAIGPGNGQAPVPSSGAVVRQETAPGPSRPPRGTKVDRPALGPAPELPERSDFRKPDGPPVAPVTAPATVGGWSVEYAAPEPSVTTAGFIADSIDAALGQTETPGLRELLLDSADALSVEQQSAPATDEQRAALKELLLPVGLDAVAIVLRGLWKLTELRQIRAAQAAAILAAGADPAFLERFSALATELGAAPAAEMSFSA